MPKFISDPCHETVLKWVEGRAADLSAWSRLIWDFAEPAWREYLSAAWYVDVLESEGFEVEKGSGGMPTAFCAVWRNGKGPTLAAYAEYDAVPGNCQVADVHRAPRPGFSLYAPGHTDPHSALGIGSLGGILATKMAMTEHNLQGTLKFFGEPAEKVQGSKVVHALQGYYDDVDTIISFHPCYMLPLSNTARWDTHCGACCSKIYSFICDVPETWQKNSGNSPIPVSHADARAPGANAALFAMYSAVKTMQDSMLGFSGGWSISEAVLSAGQATADNLPHHISQIQYLWRTPDIAMQEKILTAIDSCALHAAKISHCRLVERWVTRTRPGVANHTLASFVYDNLKRAGPPKFDGDAIDIAREIQRNISVKPTKKPFMESCETLISPQMAEKKLRETLPPWQKNFTSDDYVEMTRHAPTARFYVGRPMLQTPPGFGCPHWAMNALGGIPQCIAPTILCASKTIGLSLTGLLRAPEVLRLARAEFVERIGGKSYIPPLLPKNFRAPIGYRWPEYIMRNGKREWTIPANPEMDGTE